MLARLLARISRLLGGKVTRTAPARNAVSYAAVTVTTTTTFCEAARATQSKPILLSAEPKLPLPDCSRPDTCICRFRHWPDRRIGERRLPIDAADPLQAELAKKRSGRDRRK